MEKVYIYCDEFGTSTLKQNDVKNITKFVYSSIIIRESQLEKAKKVREEISSKLLFGQKIKSNSKRLSNDDIRIQCLNYMYNNLGFMVHFLIVDKDKLNKDKGGLRFKEVFYKYFQNIFISELAHSFNDFEIIMHHTISEKYGAELKNYLGNRVKDNLFENYNFTDDNSEPLIQFADLLAGSYGKCFNKDFESTINDNVINLLKRNSTISFFPEEKKADSKPIYSQSEIDEDIYQIVRADALELFQKDETDYFQKKILELLLQYQKIAPLIYIQTYEIINYLKNHYNRDISTEQLRLIVRDIRFCGVIIASSNNKSGYKLAVNREDIYNYFNHYSKYILPMLKKVQIANDVLSKKTVGEFIPLKDFEELASLVNKIKFNI